MENENKQIGKRINYARKQKKMSMKKLGELVNLHESTISRYEKGEIISLDIEKMKEFANSLGVTPSWLMGWEDDLLEYVAEEDKDTVKHFMKYNPYDLDMTDEEMSIKKLLNTFGYDLSHNESGYYIIDDYGAFLIKSDELTSLLNETKKYLQFNIDKMRKERTNNE